MKILFGIFGMLSILSACGSSKTIIAQPINQVDSNNSQKPSLISFPVVIPLNQYTVTINPAISVKALKITNPRFLETWLLQPISSLNYGYPLINSVEVSTPDSLQEAIKHNKCSRQVSKIPSNDQICINIQDPVNFAEEKIALFEQQKKFRQKGMTQELWGSEKDLILQLFEDTPYFTHTENGSKYCGGMRYYDTFLEDTKISFSIYLGNADNDFCKKFTDKEIDHYFDSLEITFASNFTK